MLIFGGVFTLYIYILIYIYVYTARRFNVINNFNARMWVALFAWGEAEELL